MTNCFLAEKSIGCFNGTTPVEIHTVYSTDATGAVVLKTRITDATGVVVAGASATNTVVGACTTQSLRPHVFTNATIPAGASTWGLPATASSPVGRYLVTVRDSAGATISIRVTSTTTTQFVIQAALSISNVSIFVVPIQTTT
jgi:hypothetical protein